MDSRWMLLIGLAIIAITETNALCGCALLGKDYCRCEGSIVRPVRPLTCNSLPRRFCNLVGCGQNYSPIGDSCSCGLNLVRPAHIPRTLCGCRRLAISQEKCDCQEPAPVPAPCETTKDYPADAVSLGLAYRLAKQETVNVPESRLCYGFESKPEECPKKTINTNVPEENLWAMNRAILQLKQPKQSQPISEEQYEEFEESQDNQPYLGYKDIGYAEEENNNPTFVVQKQTSVPNCRDRLPRPNVCRCSGYRPGSLIVQQQVIYPHHNGQTTEDLRECECRDASKEDSAPQSVGCDCGCQAPIIQRLRGCLRRCK